MNPNKADRYRLTPLHWAAESGHTATAKALVEAGADVKKATNSGKTPLQLAHSYHRKACIEYLRFVSGPWTLGRKSNLTKMPESARRRAFTAILCLTRLRVSRDIEEEVLRHCHL